MVDGKKVNRNFLVIGVVLILAVAGGGYYYLGVYMPDLEARREALLTLTAIGDPISLDPALCYDTESNRVVINLYDRLVSYKTGTTEIEPAIATSWETPDAMTFIFHLRDDVFFHDGTHLDAYSVKYSFDRVLELEGANQYLLSSINNTEVIDPTTIRIELNYEFYPFLSILAHPVASIVSPTAAEELGEDFTRNPIGSGPFKFESWEPEGELVLVAYEDYYRGEPRLQKIVFNPTKESTERKNALEQGIVDVVVDGILAADLPDLESNTDIIVHSAPSSTVEFLGYNTLIKPLNDSRVREAISYAIDYDRIIDEVMDGRAERIGGPIPPTIFAYKQMPLIQRDLNRARELLDEAGYQDGFQITLTYNVEAYERKQVAEIIKINLAEVGIDVTLKGLEWESAIDEYLTMGHELMLNSWVPDYNDPDSILFAQYHSVSSAPYGANVYGLNDSNIDMLIDEGAWTTDLTARFEIYQQAQDLIVEENICTYLYVPLVYDCVRDNVKNWVHNPSEYLELYELYKE